MKAFLCFTAAALASAFPVVISAAEAAPAVSAQTRRGEINAALERTDLPAAWRSTRAWIDAAPKDPAARLAEAELYLRLNAPAAAITSAGAGLAAITDQTRHLERPLLALKAQAHTLVGEHAPAWAAFSRIVAQAGAADQGDPIVAMARRARWESYVQLSASEEYAGFLDRITATGTADGASAADRLRLTEWIATSKTPIQALDHLRPQLLTQPQSAELRFGFADLFFRAVVSCDSMEEINALYAANRDAVALLRAHDTDPLGALAISLHQELNHPAPDLERQPPRNPAMIARNFATTFTERWTRLFERVIAAKKLSDAANKDRETLSASSSPADFVAWEKKQLPATLELRTAYDELTRLNGTAAFLIDLLKQRTEGAAGTAEERQILAGLEKAYTATDAHDVEMSAASEALSGFSRQVLAQRTSRRIAEAHAGFAVARTPAEQLAATDLALALGDNSPALWRQRLAAARTLGDHAEGLASGARAFVAEWVVEGAASDRELPETTNQLLTELEKEAAGAAPLLASATAAWEGGSVEAALAHLDHALQLDPALPAAWRLRWQWCEQGGDLAGAALALERWWRLDDCTPYDRSMAFGIASRAGAWPLLLSLADARLAVDPTDTEAIYYRAHAALACHRPGIVRASLPLLAASVQRDAATLLGVALSCFKDNADVTSGSASSLRGSPEVPAGLATLFACHERLKRGSAAPVTAAQPSIPATHPEALHIERLEGRLSPVDYLSRTRGTPQEPIAAFVSLYLGSLEGMSPESRERAAAVSADARLPLAMRALAHRLLVADGTVKLAPSLRASDLYYASAASAEAPWGAPGQEVFVETSVDTTTIPAGWPVRLRGPVDARVSVKLLDTPKPGEPATRLWELRSIMTTDSFYSYARAQRPVLLASDSLFVRASLKIAGAAWIDGCEFVSGSSLTVAAGGTVELREPSGELLDTAIAGALRMQGGQLSFTNSAKVAATGRVEVQRAKLQGALPFALEPGAQATWREVFAYGNRNWPAQLPVGWILQGVRIQSLAEDRSRAHYALPAPHTGTFSLLAPRYYPATKAVKTIAELYPAVAQAKPGDVIQLVKGDYLLESPLDVPAGVSIYAASGVKFDVTTGTSAAFRIMQPGAVRIVGIISAVAARTTQAYGSTVQLQDDNPKTAVVVGRDAWAMIEGGSYYGWHHRAHQVARVEAGGRLEFYRHELSDKISVDPRGEFVIDNASYNPAGKLLAAIRLRTRDEQWRDAIAHFNQAIARSTSRADREKAAKLLANTMGETADRTSATKPEGARALLTALVPVLLRYPSETPQIYGAASNYHVDHEPTAREMIPASLIPYFKTYVASFNQAQTIGLSKVSVDNVYGLMLAYPPGSALHADALSAMARNLTPAEFQTELANKQKRAAELAVALEKQRKDAAARAAEEAKRPKTYANTYSGSSSGSSWSPTRTYTVPSTPPPPAWTPSETYKMQMYRRELDVKIYKATRGY